jgi:ribonuclease E
MTDTPESNDTPTNEPQPETTSSSINNSASESTGTTKKKTTKKTAKKTTKKAATKKTTKKKVAKTGTKKTTRKRASTKAEPSEHLADEEFDASADESVNDSDTESKTTTEPRASDAEDSGSSDSKKTTQRSSKKTSKKTTTRKVASSRGRSKPKADEPIADCEMIINYVPGEECRVAMVEDGKLEELAVEPTDHISRVGNIYVGRVANVEPAIQAVFVDFGTEENGFLHVSDLHPRYFAKGDDKTERVGKKTPRKSRPPVQDCLKRGQEIIVQVLKEGVGTKGPTLTSYLSIPGRFLVMMPDMDKVGVSRKEEDDDKRRAAKEILSQLDLPEGFGFILRTAGFDRTKAELKRDLAYLARLWKDMETRRKKGNKPRLLYTESDLLVRSIRDLLTSEVTRVVIDSEPALKRVARFIKIAAPRAGAKLSHYTGTKPIFHAFGIETQINEIHSREVMLPSGGRLVIDQTEALVAIDVNSGKSRGARDAETNAFKTNMEAVDAICRQLRLRDLGGLVVNDMIDMRYHSHRKDVEARFNQRLKRDRAKSSTAPISPFGLLEMTRQRMRGSMESQHFADCPMCHGRGLVQRPDSVAASALRDLAALLDHEKVDRAELVVNPRVASALLSTKRGSLTRIELISGKKLDVRVSESLPIDRVSFYAYDETGSDITIEKLKPARGKKAEPSVVEWRDESAPDGSWAMDPLDEVDETTVQKLAEEIARKAEQTEHAELPIEGEFERDEDSDDQPKKKRRRRRRRGGRGRSGEEQGESSETPQAERDQREPVAEESPSSEQGESEPSDEATKKKRRRRRRGRGRGESDTEQSSDQQGEPQRESGRESQADSDSEPTPEPEQTSSGEESENDQGTKRPRRRPRRRPARESSDSESSPRSEQPAEQSAEQASSAPEADRVAEPKPKSRSRSRTTKKAPVAAAKSETPAKTPEPSKPKRGLYAKSRRVLSASELAKLGLD